MAVACEPRRPKHAAVSVLIRVLSAQRLLGGSAWRWGQLLAFGFFDLVILTFPLNAQ